VNNILERVELKGFNKTLWRKIGQAMIEYDMVQAGDKVAIAISGGKDSVALFNALLRIKALVNFEFELMPVHIYNTDLDFEGFKKVQDYFEEMGHPITVISANLGDIIREQNAEKSACSLCSRLRRGILYTFMKKNGCNKLALGHHLDDIIETYFMNMFFQGNSNIMRPKYYSDEHGVTVIRPMAHVEEKVVIKYMRKGEFPVFKDNCRYVADKNTQRENMKEVVESLEKFNPQVRSSIKNALKI